jgi:hypothetical protein
MRLTTLLTVIFMVLILMASAYRWLGSEIKGTANRTAIQIERIANE